MKHLGIDIGDVELMRASRRDLYVVDMEMTEVQTCLLLKKTFSTSQCAYLRESRRLDVDNEVDLNLDDVDVKDIISI